MAPATLEKTEKSMSPVSAGRTTQMNTRIDASLKKRGDRIFARAHRTPTQMVRSLWNYADRHADSPQAIDDLLTFLEEEPSASEADCRLQSMQEARQTVGCFFQTWGIDPSVPKPYESLSDYLDALREEEALESLREQGYAL